MIQIRCTTTSQKLIDKGIDLAYGKNGQVKIDNALTQVCTWQSWWITDETYFWIQLPGDEIPQALINLIEQFGTWEVVPSAAG